MWKKQFGISWVAKGVEQPGGCAAWGRASRPTRFGLFGPSLFLLLALYIYKYPSDGRKEQTMGSTEKLQPLVSLLEHSSNKWNCNWHHVAMMCNDGLYK